MRVVVKVSAEPGTLPWDSLLGPGRGLAYEALAVHAPALGRRFHQEGHGPYHLRPFGFAPPVFPQAPRVPGSYAVGGVGRLELTSPLLTCAQAFAHYARSTPVLRWGPLPLRVLDAAVIEPPAFTSGRAELHTVTPTIVKGRGGVFLLPGDQEWPVRLTENLRRKAATLELDDELDVDVAWVGRPRLFRVQRSARRGVPVTLRVSGAPETLRALWSWGVGESNSAGFGCVAA